MLHEGLVLGASADTRDCRNPGVVFRGLLLREDELTLCQGRDNKESSVLTRHQMHTSAPGGDASQSSQQPPWETVNGPILQMRKLRLGKVIFLDG